MTTRTKGAKPRKKKAVDLPPSGPSNPDPLTGAAGSHPIEAGVGAALVGAASGFAAGALGGPVGAVIGAAIGGAVVGGLAGKGVGELIDPTTEEEWLTEYFLNRKENPFDRKQEDYRTAYRYGLHASHRHRGRSFDEVEPDLIVSWPEARGESELNWDEARSATRDAFERAREHHTRRDPAPTSERSSNVHSSV